MYSGIALYNTEKLNSKNALDLAETFFKIFDLIITSAGYYKKIEYGAYKGEHDIVMGSLSDLKKQIGENNTISFRIYSEKNDIKPWYASFGYTTEQLLGFSYIDIQYPSICNESKLITKYINSLDPNITFSYGINYSCEKVTTAFYYATDTNLSSIYLYEKTSLFEEECPGRFKGKARYKASMLRMVYPVNIINSNHLDIIINNITLKEWIFNNKKNGSIIKMKNNMWLWLVDSNQIDRINKTLGETGVLISWSPLHLEKKKRKLP
ncbi:hypothetical protein [Proteus cibi]|uniref:hypothetical protein n=1 Tax=Proteus cibi TaxID=2050966 RepID=UPI0035A65898